MVIAVIGDATMDVTVGPSGPMAAGDARAPISVGPGGQGANVAVWLARAGVPARLIAPLADDAAGRVLRAQLESEGVEVRAIPAWRTSVVVVLVDPRGARTMFSDRLPVNADVAQYLAGCDWVHVSGYVLRDHAEAGPVVDAIEAAGARYVSVAGGSFEGSGDAEVAREAIERIGPALLVVNRDEAGLLAHDAGGLSVQEAATALASRDRLAVVTDGERGAAAAAGWIQTTLVSAAAPAKPSVDSTGAGDAFTASLIAELASGWPPSPDGVAAALELAAREGAAATTAIGAQSVGAARNSGGEP